MIDFKAIGEAVLRTVPDRQPLSLGVRMKRYEQAQALHLTRRIPVIVRVDGRAFHTLTRDMAKPYDDQILCAMSAAAADLARHIDGCRLAYVQSDEASFLVTDFARLETEAWFGYDLQKVVSLAAAGMTARFAAEHREPDLRPRLAEFDARAFNLPIDEVANYFLWRARDWHRNSILMFAQSHFSHRELHGKKLADIHEMLYVIGRNWATDTTEQQRNGTFITPPDGRRSDVLPNYTDVAALVREMLAPEEAP